MEATVNTLEAQFQKADSDLNYVALKLESEFSQQFCDIGEDELNPSRLLKRIQVAKSNLTSLMKEASEIFSEQQEAQTFVTENLLACQDLLCHTEARAGLEVPERTSDEHILRSSRHEPKDVQSRQYQVDIPFDLGKENNPSTMNGVTKAPNKAIRCSNPAEFIPVTDEEFSSVSTLVRGRVKLQDVNKVYEFLYNHFKKNKKSPALTPSDMTKMGQKVTGATGEAKLKVLRALKILDMSNKGAVKLL